MEGDPIIDECVAAINKLFKGVLPKKLNIPQTGTISEMRLVESINTLISSFAEADDFLSSLSEGRLDLDPPKKNFLVANFKQLHSNLRHLTWQAGQVAMGDLNQQVDFLGDFSTSFNSMIVSLREKKRLEDELNLAYSSMKNDLAAAARLLERLLPEPSIINGYRFDSMFRPSAFIGGDIFNYFSLDDENIGFYLLDVVGHGIPSALLSFSVSKTLSPADNEGNPLKRYNLNTERFEILSPSEAGKAINMRFQKPKGTMQYFSMVYGVIEIASGRLRFIQAGHPDPIISRTGYRPEYIGSGGLPVGIMQDINYDEYELELDETDRFFVYSDGVIECQNNNGDFYGETRLNAFIDNNRDVPLNELMQILKETLIDFKGGNDFNDDVSIIVIERIK